MLILKKRWQTGNTSKYTILKLSLPAKLAQNCAYSLIICFCFRKKGMKRNIFAAPWITLQIFTAKYRISCKVSRAIFYNLSLLGATNFQGFQDFYLINKPFWCDYVLRATMYQGRIRIQEIRYVKHEPLWSINIQICVSTQKLGLFSNP